MLQVRELADEPAAQRCRPAPQAAQRNQSGCAIPRPSVHCGCCGEPIDEPGLGRRTRCRHCHRALAIPPRLRVVCAACGRGQHINPRAPAAQLQCSGCGESIALIDVVLPPLHRALRHRRAHAASQSGAGDWAVVVFALILVIALLAVAI